MAIERAGGVVVYDVSADGMTLPGPDWLRGLLGQWFFCEARTAQFFDDDTAQLFATTGCVESSLSIWSANRLPDERPTPG